MIKVKRCPFGSKDDTVNIRGTLYGERGFLKCVEFPKNCHYCPITNQFKQMTIDDWNKIIKEEE